MILLIIGIVTVSPNAASLQTDAAFLCYPISWKDQFGLDKFIEQQNQCRAYSKYTAWYDIFSIKIISNIIELLERR